MILTSQSVWTFHFRTNVNWSNGDPDQRLGGNPNGVLDRSANGMTIGDFGTP